MLGGYVAGSQALRDYLIQRARPFLFSTSHPPAVVAACLAAIDVLEDEPERIERLWDNTRFFKAGLSGLGFDTGHQRDADHAGHRGRLGAWPAASAHGCSSWASSPRRSSTRRSRSTRPACARSSRREHTRDDLQTCLDAFATVGRELRLIDA